jgi:N-acetyl sugar amidotransferase
MQICSRCIFDARTPGIIFDDQGACNYCKQVDDLSKEYQTGLPEGEARLQGLIAEIKKSGRNRKYNCVIGVSGGTDSSYLLIKAKEWGLRPLAVHYDNTWNSSIATQNIQRVTSALDIDLYTYVIDNKEADDIFRAFLLAGVPEFDASTDIAFAQVLRLAAAIHGIKYILEGHSFIAEGVSPQANNYFDGKYIQSVHRMFGSRKLKTYPNLTLLNFLKWSIIYRQKFVRPLWYINYSKSDARKLLQVATGWKYYGGHHLENRATAFLHTVYNPQKFSIDNRNWSLSAEARTSVISREDALAIYQEPVPEDRELVNYVKKRLGLSDSDYTAVMNGPKRSYRDFVTYKKTFERLRLLFFILARANLVPKSFYLKYCFPHKDPA